MKPFRMGKTHILIMVYIILIVTELFFFVPYHSIQIFRTNQNVPHTEIIGSGYSTMENITSYSVNFSKNKYTSDIGKIVNTSQLFMNVSITTVLAVAIYFLLQKKEEVSKTQDIETDNITFTDEELNEMPVLDVNSLAFAIEEEIVEAQRDYARKVANYIMCKMKRNNRQQNRGEQLTLFDIIDKW